MTNYVSSGMLNSKPTHSQMCVRQSSENYIYWHDTSLIDIKSNIFNISVNSNILFNINVYLISMSYVLICSMVVNKLVSKMTYYVSSGTLNSTHSREQSHLLAHIHEWIKLNNSSKNHVKI